MAAGRTYTPIARTTLSTTSSTVTFSSISGSYTDLVLVVNGSIDSTNTPSLAIRLNSDTGNSYSSTIMEGNGTAAYSQKYSGSRTLMQFNYYTAFYSTNIANAILHIQNYSNATTYKTVLCRFNITGGNAPGTAASVGLYRGSTSAVTSISISPDFGAINFSSGSTFTLYGIAAA